MNCNLSCRRHREKSKKNKMHKGYPQEKSGYMDFGPHSSKMPIRLVIYKYPSQNLLSLFSLLIATC